MIYDLLPQIRQRCRRQAGLHSTAVLTMNFTDFNLGRFYNADCFDVFKEMPDGCVDMVLCDLPYGTTACKWDTVIPFEPLWAEYKRVCKPNAAIVLTASQPFTSALVMSNPKMFKYCWVWEKTKPSGFMNAKARPLKNHEDVVVFSGSRCDAAGGADNMNYYPQGLVSVTKKTKNSGKVRAGVRSLPRQAEYTQEWSCYPNSVLQIASEITTFHPTQKPVALFEYLIRTYTNEGDLVLDNCAGSGTTAVACENLKRRWVCIEKEKEYYDKALTRLNP